MTRVRSQGFLNLKFNIVTKDLTKLGYVTNQNEYSNMNHASSQMSEINAQNLAQALGLNDANPTSL